MTKHGSSTSTADGDSAAGGEKQQSRLRQIPSVEKLLATEAASALSGRYGRDQVKRSVVDSLALLRRAPGFQRFDEEELWTEVAAHLDRRFAPSLRRVVNGTGIIIHTNLGRAPVDPELWRDAGEVVTHYSNLEFDLAQGSRGSRSEHLSALAAELFGAEAAILTNNNAAAVLLLLAATAAGREVIVSRGELVEIGGGFRVPDVIVQGGAKLREVGTTNKTRKSDYAKAADSSTAAILRVHRSNFEIVGFTESPSVEDLVAVAREKKLPLFYDEGSGCVVDIATYGFAKKPTIRELLDAGVDVVTFSGDKLFGATQGGLIVGRREIVDRCAKHPLMRALRAGKESYAVITETLRSYLAGRHEECIPVYRMLSMSLEQLRARAEKLAKVKGVSVVETQSALGGGTTPTESLPSIGIAIEGSANALHAKLLAHSTPIVGRIVDDRLTLDLRTIDPGEDRTVATAIAAVSR